MCMFDFNGDGHTDSGEHFIGYQIFKDVTSGSSSGGYSHGKIDGWTIFLIVIIGYAVLNTICDWLY